MKASLVSLFMVLSLTAAIGARAATPCWRADPSRSTLGFTGLQAGAPARGEFKKFSSIFCFSNTSVSGKLEVKVSTASVDTHNDTRDDVLRGQNFFDVKRFPLAIYKARSFTRIDHRRFRANGTLTVRGIAKPVAVDFSFLPGPGGTTATAKGHAMINRTDFNLGQGRWSNTRWVGAHVKLVFNLALKRNPGS